MCLRRSIIHRSPNFTPHHRFAQARNKCSAAKELFVRCKAEDLLSSATGRRTFWSIAKPSPTIYAFLSPSHMSLKSSFLNKRVISIRVDGVLSQPFLGFPQRLSTCIHPFLFNNDFLSTISNPLHSFANDPTIRCSLSCCASRCANTNINLDRCVARLSLNFDLEHISHSAVQKFCSFFIKTLFFLPMYIT